MCAVTHHLTVLGNTHVSNPGSIIKRVQSQFMYAVFAGTFLLMDSYNGPDAG